jgi:exosortase
MSQTLSVPMSAPAATPRTTRRHASMPLPVAVAAVVLLVAHMPLLWRHMHVLDLKPHYEFYPLVFLGAAVLAWPAWRLVRAGHRPGPVEWKIGLGLLGLNWLILMSAIAVDSPWLGMISFWELVATVALLAGGWQVLRATVPALIFLLLIIPPPFNLDGKLVLSLQTVTSRVSSRVLDRLGTMHYLDGNTFEVGAKKYFVDKACSGINSLFSTIAVTLFCVLYFGASWLRTVLLFLAAVFWVVVANVTRVTSIVWLDNAFGIDLSKDKFEWAKDFSLDLGFTVISVPGPHALLGFALFGVVLAMMYSTNRFLMFIGTAVRWGDAAPRSADEPSVPTDAPAPRSVGWGIVLPALAAYGLLVVFQAGEMQLGAAVTESSLVKSYNAWTEGDLPEQIGSWARQKDGSTFDSRDRDNPFGAHSRTWQYRNKAGQVAIISFDYPFPEWHDLRMCYDSIGWGRVNSERLEVPVGGVKLDCVKLDMAKEHEHRGYLWFTEFDQTGNPIPVHVPDLTRSYVDKRWGERFANMRDRWLSLFGKAKAPPSFMDVLQVQVLVEDFGAMPQEAQDQVQTFFVQAAELIRAKCAAGLPSGSK